ncbi:MAG: thioredoxin family protein [Rubritalea sp.]
MESIVSEMTGESLPAERRQGISRVYNASTSDVKLWLAEPNVLVVLNFHSSTCPASKALSPKLDAMAIKYAEHSAIMKVNVGRPGEAATMAMNEYQIDETPVLKFFLNGKEVDELRSVQNDEKLERAFKKHTEKIKGEFTMKEGELPGSQNQRSVEDMMVRGKRGDLPAGITRVRVPEGAKDVTEGLAKSILSNSPVAEELVEDAKE